MYKSINLWEATTPLNIKPNDPGLLTFQQYYEMRNPGGKHHDTDAFTTNIHGLNFRMILPTNKSGEIILTRDNKFLIRYDQPRNNSKISIFQLKEKQYNSEGKIVAVYYANTWYYHPKWIYLEDLEQSDLKGQYKQHKYPERVLEDALKSVVRSINKQRYGKPIKRIKLSGEYVTIHDDSEYDSLVVMNSDDLVIANASNEWGATLLQVADEYKGKGIGPILGEMFIDHFNLPSGGYSNDGFKNAKKIWNNRVSDFIRNGWYSELLKAGRISKEQVQEILNNFKSSKRKQEKVPSLKGKPSDTNNRDYLVFVDDQQVTFIIYDKEFFKDQDEKYIYGHTFLRDSGDNTEIVYTFDYDDDESRKLLSYVLLQSQRDKGKGVNVQYVGSDLFEYDDLKNVQLKDDGMLYLTKDMLDIDKLQNIEQKYRSIHDQYDEIYHQLLEIAESKYK